MRLFNTAMCASAGYRQWLLPICQLVAMAQKSLRPDVFSVSAAMNAQECLRLNTLHNAVQVCEPSE